MNMIKSKEFWFGFAAACLVLKFVVPKVPALGGIASRVT